MQRRDCGCIGQRVHTFKSLLKTHLFSLAFDSSATYFWTILFYFILCVVDFMCCGFYCSFSWGYILLMYSTLVNAVVLNLIYKYI